MVILAQPFMFLLALSLSSKLQITNIIGEREKKKKKEEKREEKPYFDK
jgi:hypothetical protein